MKAKYKAGRPEDNLTIGKKYDVEDVRCKKGFEASEVYLKNDKQQKCWYSVELFTMYAESALPIKMGAADATLGAAALATPEQPEVAIKTVFVDGESIQQALSRQIAKKMCDTGLMYGA